MASPSIAQRRLHCQRLLGTPLDRPQDVVQWLGAIQAQDYAGAKWGIAQRTKGAASADIDRALDAGTILRTHVLRPTWHLVTPEDIRWLLSLTTPRVHAANAYYYRKLELDDRLLGRSNAALARALVGGRQLTRVELAQVLKKAGIVASGLRLGYLMMRAELDAVICSGALRGKQHTYALLDERVPKAKTLTREDALAELTQRYFTSHGPALAHDFASWSGLTLADVKTGLALAKSRLASETTDGKTYWFSSSAKIATSSSAVIHLLPNYDEFLIAYKDYSPSFDASRYPSVASLNKILGGHILVRGGQVIGGWRRTLGRNTIGIEIQPLVRLTAADKIALQGAIERYGQFMELPITLT